MRLSVYNNGGGGDRWRGIRPSGFCSSSLIYSIHHPHPPSMRRRMVIRSIVIDILIYSTYTWYTPYTTPIHLPWAGKEWSWYIYGWYIALMTFSTCIWYTPYTNPIPLPWVGGWWKGRKLFWYMFIVYVFPHMWNTPYYPIPIPWAEWWYRRGDMTK